MNGSRKLDYLEKGIPNLLKHIENVTVKFGLPVVVALNRFPQILKRVEFVEDKCRE